MPNPYDDSLFYPRDCERMPLRHLLFAGRLAPVKGLDLLLYALRQAIDTTSEDWRLTVIGAGISEGSYRDLARRLDLETQVTFAGRMEGEDLAMMFASHRILVMPSRPTPAEAFPLVPIEAAACGSTVIASNVGGLSESLGGSGVLVEPTNVSSLATAIVSLAKDLEVSPAKAPELTHLSLHTVAIVSAAYEEALLNGYKGRLPQPRVPRSGAKRGANDSYTPATSLLK